MSFDAFASNGGSPSQVSQETSAPAESTDTTPTPPPAAPAQPAPQPEPIAAEKKEWSPNFKFNVMDQEHEMDEYFRQFIKSEQDEAKFRELYEKAYGLDVVKPKFQAAKEKLQQVEPRFNTLISRLQELEGFSERGDFDNFFKRLNINEEKVLQWVIKKAQYNELPPEQRKALDEQRSVQERAYLLEQENKQIRQQYEAYVTQAKEQGLQIALERPDVRQLASQFDAKQGRPGAFRQEVINYADYIWHSTRGQTDLTPEEAVQAIVERLTVFGGPQYNQPQVVPAAGVQPVQPAPRTKPIPNLQSRSVSSVGKPKPKSLADLKKLAESFSD